MRNAITRGAVAAALAAVAPLAGAHELTCRATATLLAVNSAGNVAVDGEGLPVGVGSILPVLTVRSYPAVVGVQVGIQNVANAPSTITGVWDTLDSTGGAPAMRFGPLFGNPVTLPVGGSVVTWFAYRIDDQAECLHAFGGQVDAPACTNDATDFRFVATHDVGSTECRARVVCAAPPVAMSPPPPPVCPPTWHGVQFGTTNDDGGYAIALDQQCNVDVAGFWNSPARLGNSGGSAFLAQLGPDGSVGQILPWKADSTAFGAYGTGVAVDLDGNRFLASNVVGVSGGYVTKFGPSSGWTSAAMGVVEKIAVDVAGNVYAVGGDSSGHGLVAKLSAADGQFVWVREIPGSSRGLGIALDQAGNVLATGVAVDAFVVKLDQGGNVLWTRFIGTDHLDVASSIATDGAGNAYVGGATSSAFPGNAFAGVADAFVAKVDAAGNLVWVRQFGGPDADIVNGVAADAAGDVWATGTMALENAFVAKLDPAGDLLFVTPFVVPTGVVDPLGITLDALGDAFVTGVAVGNLGGGTGGRDAFVAKFDPLGNLQ